MDLTTNDLFLLIKKKINDKLNKNIKNFLPSILVRKNQKFKLQEKEENYDNYYIGMMISESNVANFLYNSINPKIIACFNNIQYLSITNNYLINLDFIIKMPDLLYLDVFGNPLDEFSSLNYKNIFGYLRLSVDKFHENKILNISGLICAIFEIEIKDKNNLKLFKINNPNIFMINNEINYYIDKLSNDKKKTYNIKKKNKLNQFIPNENITINAKKRLSVNYFKTNFLKYDKDASDELNNSKANSVISEKSSSEDDDDNYNNYTINKNKILKEQKIEIKNSFLLEIKNFFEELEQILAKITKKINKPIEAKNLINEKLYLNIEKKRILLLYQNYLRLSIFNDKKKDGSFYFHNNNSDNCNKFSDNIKIYEIKKYIKCININIRFGLIILTTILFYSLNLISMKLSVTIIHYILLKYYKYDEHKQIPDITSFGNFHYLCYYFDNLEDFRSKLKFAEKSQIDLYQKILDILEIKKLILKSNLLKQKKDENENKKNMSLIDDNSTKNKVSSLLLFMKELKIDNDILVLIEFFCDFIIYENMEQIVINGSFNDEYSTLIEIKEILEQNELDKNNLSIRDLSNKKYYKNKLERIFNKFYFENKKIKIIKNKNFKNLNNKPISSKFDYLSFINKWNKDYIKNDEINIKNCFNINKLIIPKIDLKKENNLKEIDIINNEIILKNNYYSEEKTNYNQAQNSFEIISENRKNNKAQINLNIENIYNNESKIKDNYKTLYNNKYSNLTVNDNQKIKLNIERNKNGKKSSVNIFNKNRIYNKDYNSNIINQNSKNTFNEIYKYFDQSN